MKWVSPEDRPFPVVASVSYFNAEGDLVEITMDFHDFQDGATSQENFQPPRDITCMNRKDAAPLGIRLPNQFAYETELVVNDEPASSSPSTTSIRTILGYTRVSRRRLSIDLAGHFHHTVTLHSRPGSISTLTPPRSTRTRAP